MWATEWFMKAQIEQLKEENRALKLENIAIYRVLQRLEEENKKLNEDVDFFYKSAKQFIEQIEKWEKDFAEWRIVEKD